VPIHDQISLHLTPGKYVITVLCHGQQAFMRVVYNPLSYDNHPLRILPASATWHRRCRRHFWYATLRLRSAIRRHHPPQRAVLSQICCFRKHKVVLFQILLDSAEPCDAGTTSVLILNLIFAVLNEISGPKITNNIII